MVKWSPWSMNFLFFHLTEAISGTWSKKYNTYHNKWSNCHLRRCETASNVSYCKNLARHESKYGANLILYNPNTKRCCKKYCDKPNYLQVITASGTNSGYEMWIWKEKSEYLLYTWYQLSCKIQNILVSQGMGVPPSLFILLLAVVMSPPPHRVTVDPTESSFL